MSIKPIKNEADYEMTLARLDEIFQAPAGTLESDEADVLVTLIEGYESAVHPIEAPDPIAAIRIRMEEKGLRNTDLVSSMGSKSRVTEVLKKRRPLTVAMIHALSKQLNLSASKLVQPYALDPYHRTRKVSKPVGA